MARIVLLRAQQPVLVVTPQTQHLGGTLAPKRENGVDTPSRIGSSIDVVPEEYDRVACSGLVAELPQEVEQRCKIPVDISDRECGHTKTGRSYLNRQKP
jgi:hypothetical protein